MFIMKKGVLDRSCWTEHLLQPSPDWMNQIDDVPVVRITRVEPGGEIIDEKFAVTTPVIDLRGVKRVTLNYERGHGGGDMCTMGVEVEILRVGGWVNFAGVEHRVEFVGLAGQKRHRSRRWSYISK